MTRTPWTGCGTALVTPFGPSGAVDESALRRLTKRQIDAGVHFLIPCGTTGEAQTLTAHERRRVVEIVVEESAGRVPVLAGAGGYNTAEVIVAGREMREIGADGILSVAPYYNKPTQEGLYQHYAAIAGEVGLPVMVYNVPGRTGCNIDTATHVRLADVPGIVGVKEASGNMSQICEIRRALPDRYVVLAGDDAIGLPTMAIGGQGVISVASNEIPVEIVRLLEAAMAGDFTTARAIHTRLFELMLVNFVESNPIPVKAAMAMMGLIEERYRLPLVPLGAPSRARLTAVLTSLNLIG